MARGYTGQHRGVRLPTVSKHRAPQRWPVVDAARLMLLIARTARGGSPARRNQAPVRTFSLMRLRSVLGPPRWVGRKGRSACHRAGRSAGAGHVRRGCPCSPFIEMVRHAGEPIASRGDAGIRRCRAIAGGGSAVALPCGLRRHRRCRRVRRRPAQGSAADLVAVCSSWLVIRSAGARPADQVGMRPIRQACRGSRSAA